jgi:hypothetical protein
MICAKINSGCTPVFRSKFTSYMQTLKKNGLEDDKICWHQWTVALNIIKIDTYLECCSDVQILDVNMLK